MKYKAIKIIMWSIVIAVSIAIVILSYLMIADIETKQPNKIEYTCEIEVQKFMGRKIFVVTPKNVSKTDNFILYFHGGAYMAEATKEHWKFIEKLINDTGMTVIFPDYPLTPKYNYKDVFEMVKPLYEKIIEKVNTNNLIVMGDSAGGGISLALVQNLTEEQMPNKTILLSPWLDVRLTNPQINEVQKYDRDLNKEALMVAGISYAEEEGINNALVNPIDGDISKIKNVTIFTGTYDILNPDVHVLKEKDTRQVIEVKEYEGASHIWILKNNDEKAYQDFIEIVKK